jgi:RNA 3'-terminal phosphate cyclase
MQVERRGFYPKGGGRVRLEVASLPPGARLPAFDLLRPGLVTSVSITAFRAGRVPGDIARRMAGAAEAALTQAGMPLSGLPAKRSCKSPILLCSSAVLFMLLRFAPKATSFGLQ